MTDDSVFKNIPKDLDQKELEAVVEIYRRSISENTQNDPKEAIKIVESGVRGAVEGLAGSAILILSVPVSWFTKKWLEEYFWPIFKKHFGEPSEALVKWIFSFIKNENGSEFGENNTDN